MKEAPTPELKTYDLFVSHAWDYNDDYYRLEQLLYEAPNFRFRNYSVPKHDPLVDPNTSVGRANLTAELDGQIRPVNCVLVIAGMYAVYKYWVQKEIDLAKKYEKPIVGIRPFGQQRVPLEVQEAAVEMVGGAHHQ